MAESTRAADDAVIASVLRAWLLRRVLEKRGVWIPVAIQWNNIPVNHRHQAFNVDTRDYVQFTGRYQWRNGDDVDRIYLKGAELCSDFAGESGKLLPGNNGAFLFADDLGRQTFKRVDTGRVAGYVHRRLDGQEILAKRVE